LRHVSQKTLTCRQRYQCPANLKALLPFNSGRRYLERHVPSALAQVSRIDAMPIKRRDQISFVI
jgi:hypothetical protein